MYIGVIHSSWAAIFTAKKTTNFWKWHVTRNAWHQHLVNKSEARKQLCISACYVMRAMSTSSTSIEYYKQKYCTLFIGWLTADVTKSECHLGVMLVEFSIAHISCSVSCIELKLGTNDEEGVTQQIIPLSTSVLESFKRLGFENIGQAKLQSGRQIFPGRTTTPDNLACLFSIQNYLYERNQRE